VDRYTRPEEVEPELAAGRLGLSVQLEWPMQLEWPIAVEGECYSFALQCAARAHPEV
jgi:hypothetical protein